MKTAADRRYREFQKPCGQGAHDEDSQRPRRSSQDRDPLGQPVVTEEKRQASRRQRYGRQINGFAVCPECLDPQEKLGWQGIDLQAQKILYLRQKDDHGDPVGETNDDRYWNERDQMTEASNPHGQQKYPGQHRGTQQIGEAMDRNDAIHDGNERTSWSADLYA